MSSRGSSRASAIMATVSSKTAVPCQNLPALSGSSIGMPKATVSHSSRELYPEHSASSQMEMCFTSLHTLAAVRAKALMNPGLTPPP